MGPPLKRAKTPFIALWVLFWDVILVMVVGVIFGGISLCLLLLGLVLLIFWYSPWFSFLSACGRRLRQMEKRWIGRENPNCDKSCLKLLVVNIFQFFYLLIAAVLTDGCVVGGMSCQCITQVN